MKLVVQNIKDTSFWKQFTTVPRAVGMHDGVVQNIKDTSFWKQFTTNTKFNTIKCMLFRISKIQVFESNSQHNPKDPELEKRCSEYQRYKFLKAIHNILHPDSLLLVVVQNIKDTSFWKQFTTNKSRIFAPTRLFRISKIQVFESNSQQEMKLEREEVCCSEYQRYKFLKAIHNDSKNENEKTEVVQNIKDTSFWKQFTTYHNKA